MSWMSLLDTVGKVVGTVGSVANIAGKTFGKDVVETPQQESGFASLYRTGNPQFTDFVKNDVLQMIMNAAKQPRAARPMRRLTSADMQGDFAPQAAYALQNYGDERRAAQPEQPEGTQTDDLTKQPTQSAGNIDELKARAIRELKMASLPSGADFTRGVFNTSTTSNANRALELMPILEGMDGYKNEYTGTQFDLANYLQGLGDYYSEVNSGGVNSGLVSTQMSDKAKKASETYGQQQWNALKRPPENNMLGKAVAGLILGQLPASALLSATGKR